MGAYQDFNKASPAIADIYSEYYMDCISKVSSMTLHNLCIELGICPYCCDSLENVWKSISHMAGMNMLRDERVYHMPVQDAFHMGDKDLGFNYYVICSRYCEEEDVTYYLTLTEVDGDFFINITDELWHSSNRMDVPNCLGEILDRCSF